MNKIIYLLTPPIVPKLINRMTANQFGSKRLFSSFDEASKKCMPRGYLNQDLIDVICIRGKAGMEKVVKENTVTTDFPHLTVFGGVFYALLNQTKPNPPNLEAQKGVNIIDFGGGCGEYYFYMRQLLGQNFKINYNIVETEAMCSKARAMWNDPSLKFWPNIKDAIASLDRVDIVISSCAIQYTPDPYDVIGSIISCCPEYILFSRCSLTTGNKDLTTIQSFSLSFGGKIPMPAGYKDMMVSLPHTSIQREIFETMLSKKYQLLLKLLDDSGVVPCEGEEVVGGAYFCKRK